MQLPWIETIENFIGYLQGEYLKDRKIKQDDAILMHRKLFDSYKLESSNIKPIFKKRSYAEMMKGQDTSEPSFSVMPKKSKLFVDSNDIGIYKNFALLSLAKNKSLFKGISSLEGMSTEEIEDNLHLLKSIYKTNNGIKELLIESYLLNAQQVLLSIKYWFEAKTYQYYTGIVGIENKQGDKHAILLYGIKSSNNKESIFKIIDPLSKKDNMFTQEIEYLASDIKSFGKVSVLYSGIQGKEHGICGDISIILLQDLLSNITNLSNKVPIYRCFTDVFNIQTEYIEADTNILSLSTIIEDSVLSGCSMDL